MRTATFYNIELAKAVARNLHGTITASKDELGKVTYTVTYRKEKRTCS